MKTKNRSPTPPTHAPSNPTDLADGAEGTVAFPSRPGASYRFEVVAKDEKLHIWLEDCKTKKQWRTAQLALADFAKDELVIPHATFDDYAKCFVDCLSATSKSDCAHDLVAAQGIEDAWELRLTLKIRVFTTTWTPTYAFLLKPVSLEPVDLLAAKLRDQEDQIAVLTEQVELLEAELEKKQTVPPPFVVHATLSSNVGSGQQLVWKTDGAVLSAKTIFHTSGVIRFPIGGTFVVNAMIRNVNTNNSTAVELLVNGKVVVSCVDSDGNGHHQTTSLYHVLTAAPNDEVTVVYRGNNHAYTGSNLVVHELR